MTIFRRRRDREGTADTISNASEVPPLRHVFVDLSTIAQKDAKTGIQRVVRALWQLLDQSRLSGVIVVPIAATASLGYRRLERQGNSFVLPDAHVPLVQMREGDIFLGLDLAAHRLWRHRRQIARWKRHGAQVAITVYDLLPLREPTWFPASTVRHFRRWIRIIRRHADVALCISRHVSDDLEQLLASGWRLRRRSIRLAPLPLSGDLANSQPSQGVDDDARATLSAIEGRSMILMVGTIEPRKGHDVLLDAFDHLRLTLGDEVATLVMVGRAGWGTEALQRRMINHPARGKHFHWLDDASDEVLTRLYERAALVVVPSRGEGFGLPVVEALAYGRKVLARDLPVFRELAREGLSYFSSDRPDHLAQDIVQALRRPSPTDFPAMVGWDHSFDALLRALHLDQGEGMARSD